MPWSDHGAWSPSNPVRVYSSAGYTSPQPGPEQLLLPLTEAKGLHDKSSNGIPVQVK
jgi:hypothetical protein